jgi:hypothetical protein
MPNVGRHLHCYATLFFGLIDSSSSPPPALVRQRLLAGDRHQLATSRLSLVSTNGSPQSTSGLVKFLSRDNHWLEPTVVLPNVHFEQHI